MRGIVFEKSFKRFKMRGNVKYLRQIEEEEAVTGYLHDLVKVDILLTWVYVSQKWYQTDRN